MKIFVPSSTATPASTIQSSPNGMPVTLFAPSKQRSPMLIGLPFVPLSTPKMLAPPPISLPSPTLTLLEMRPSTITLPRVPELKFI